MSKDYYEILGLSRDASDAQIKNAYRKLAREYHPDVAKDVDKASAENRFKEINEAYQVLSDPSKRKSYDQFGHAGNAGFGGGFSGGQWGPFSYTYTNTGGQGFGDIDPFDIFEEVFGFRGFGHSRQRRGKSLHYELHIAFGETVRGAEKTINTESGRLMVKIPAGIQSGTELKFAGKGLANPSTGIYGDLFITVRVDVPREFQVVGDNIGIALEINFVQAVLGDVVDVLVVDPAGADGIGTAKLKIPQGTQPGTQFRLKGRGMPRFRGSGRGDVIVQIFVKIPSKINKSQKDLLERYKNVK